MWGKGKKALKSEEKPEKPKNLETWKEGVCLKPEKPFSYHGKP